QNPRSRRPTQRTFSQSPSVRDHPRRHWPTRLHRDLECRQIQRGPAPRRRLPLAQQPSWLVRPRILGDLYPTHGCRTRLPGFEIRPTLASHLAPILRPHSGPRLHLCLGLRPLEDTRPLGQAGWSDDADPQTRPTPSKRRPKTTSYDARGEPSGTQPDRHRRHFARNDIGPEAAAASCRASQRRTATHPRRPGPETPRTTQSRPPFVVRTAVDKT